ncbi:hypothetical protein CEUSTIGMA_g2204.t1 [Chlamydomonas eustigma]|uniref:Uncharacterized protein n=1 Tax=Chlamydomonas eustigma TaxID=1157962 RepID=A0A250WV99_9CHLO|nr:hypothetical protein CEUSTIGMA_g2204.t1 [Chlamydomonas eustigma]|eukprot:GAX74757.1 hypothetical protein CEUSTIGMA_g2204.t1 [Chlamydomonas eustigma]
MAPKKAKKGPTYCTSDDDLEPFGFRMHDIVRTPLGVAGTIIGVKYENPEQKETGRAWVRYENGNEAPLEPRLGAGLMSALGYRRCSDAVHIRRDVDAFQAGAKKASDEKKIIDKIMAFKEQGLPIPPDLLPKEKAPKKKAVGKGEKKK